MPARAGGVRPRIRKRAARAGNQRPKTGKRKRHRVVRLKTRRARRYRAKPRRNRTVRKRRPRNQVPPNRGRGPPWPLAHAALVILDVQNDFIQAWPRHKKIIPNINRVAEAARAAGLPVVHTLFLAGKMRGELPGNKALCRPGSRGAKEITALRQSKDVYLEKRGYSAFHETPLDRKLKRWRVDTLILTGLLTHCCVYATALDAVQRNYRVLFVRDACSSYRTGLHNTLLNGFFRNSIGEVASTRNVAKRLHVLAGAGRAWVP